MFFGWFNKWFERGTEGYVSVCDHLIRKTGRAMLLLVAITIAAGFFGMRLPTGFLPLEDQGYVFLNVQLPKRGHLQRKMVCRKIEEFWPRLRGAYTSTIAD